MLEPRCSIHFDFCSTSTSPQSPPSTLTFPFLFHFILYTTLHRFFFSLMQATVHNYIHFLDISCGTAQTTSNMSKPVGRWNEEAHTSLLIALLDEVKGGKAVVTKATERLNEMGYNYTYNAVKYYRKALLVQNCTPP